MSAIGSGGVSFRGIPQENFIYTCKLSGTIVDADVGLMALTQDATAANTFKPAGDGDPVYGMLASFEDRTIEGTKIGAIAMKGGYRFKVKDGSTVAVGDEVCGGGSGTVKTIAPSTGPLTTTSQTVTSGTMTKRNIVMQVETIDTVDYATVVLL